VSLLRKKRSTTAATRAGGAIVMAVSGKPSHALLRRVDFMLLLFFVSLFVVVYGANKEGWSEQIRMLFEPLLHRGRKRELAIFAMLALFGSNIFSNVPFVVLARQWVPTLRDETTGWEVLALSSTLGGNLTLIGSIANLIVFELAREKAQVSFWQYLRVGVPATVLSLALGLGWLLF
jgi:Na+/H+ antiporter NhaD/arsenite permease-like protein